MELLFLHQFICMDIYQKLIYKYYPDVELTTREILDKRIQEIVKQRNKKAGGGVAYMLGE